MFSGTFLPNRKFEFHLFANQRQPESVCLVAGECFLRSRVQSCEAARPLASKKHPCGRTPQWRNLFSMLPQNLFGWKLCGRLGTQSVWVDQFQYKYLVQNTVFPAWMETVWGKICDRGGFFMLSSVEKLLVSHQTPSSLDTTHQRSLDPADLLKMYINGKSKKSWPALSS